MEGETKSARASKTRFVQHVCGFSDVSRRPKRPSMTCCIANQLQIREGAPSERKGRNPVRDRKNNLEASVEALDGGA